MPSRLTRPTDLLLLLLPLLLRLLLAPPAAVVAAAVLPSSSDHGHAANYADSCESMKTLRMVMMQI